MSGLRVMVGGGSGFVGSALSRELRRRGHTVTLLSRSAGDGRYTWQALKKDGLPPCDAVVNLAGANILDPLKWWGDAYKKMVWDSRIDTTRDLVSAIEQSDAPPSVFVSASGISCYPFADSNMAKADMPSHDEDSSTAAGHEWPNDFVGRLQLAWEQASEGLGKSASTHGTGVDTRRVVVRTGVVLGRGGGAVQQMWYPFKCCLGGVIGAGTQPFPWVHIDDLVGVYTRAIEDPLSAEGVLNAVAPARTTNAEFTAAFGSALGRYTPFPAPAFVLNSTLGADRASLLLQGAFVAPRRTQESLGYEFKYAHIEKCMAQIVYAGGADEE